MDLFKKQESYLGVDIGSSSIKVVELVKKGDVPQLVTYGYTEEQTDIIKGGSKESQTKTSALLRAVCEKAHVSTKKSLAALPNFFVFSSIINLPSNTDKKELESAINWEAKKFVPLPLEEVVLDWKVLNGEGMVANKIIPGKEGEKKPKPPPQNPIPKNPDDAHKTPPMSTKTNNPPDKSQTIEPPYKNNKNNKNKTSDNLDILLTAAPRNLVKKYVDICEGAGLKLLSLETESFALSRSLLGVNPRPVVIIDMGALVSDVLVMEKGIPVLSRSVDVGGHTITQSVMNVLNVDANRAEQFKRDFGAPLNVGLNKLANVGSSKAASTTGVPRAISTVLDGLVQEIRYSLDLYQNQTSKQVEKVMLSGGSAFLPNFTNYLSSALSLPVYIGNPWDRVSYPTELKPILESLAPRLAVAVGLAMREIT